MVRFSDSNQVGLLPFHPLATLGYLVLMLVFFYANSKTYYKK